MGAEFSRTFDERHKACKEEDVINHATHYIQKNQY